MHGLQGTNYDTLKIMICILNVTTGPARGKRIWLRANQKMSIGRLSTIDFSIPTDPYMSREHFVVEGNANFFRLRDVGSANGTFVNESKINVVHLCDGDCIRAGSSTLTVSVVNEDANPHASDGITFGGHGTVVDEEVEPTSGGFQLTKRYRLDPVTKEIVEIDNDSKASGFKVTETHIPD